MSIRSSSPACYLQHASSDVERMILGNKCDVNDKRQVSKDRGEKVTKATVINQNEEQFHFYMVCCLSPPICCQLALDYGIKFMETSAKANINVENVSACVMFLGLDAPRG